MRFFGGRQAREHLPRRRSDSFYNLFQNPWCSVCGVPLPACLAVLFRGSALLDEPAVAPEVVFKRALVSLRSVRKHGWIAPRHGSKNCIPPPPDFRPRAAAKPVNFRETSAP